MGCFTLGIFIYMAFPNPLFFVATIISICLGEIHLKSGMDFISAYQLHFVVFFPSKQYTRFSAARSCPNTVFSDPLIIKYPPQSSGHSPINTGSIERFWERTHIDDFNIIGIFPIFILGNIFFIMVGVSINSVL